jgi:hypothetical protein
MKRLVWTITVFLMGFGIFLTDAQAKIPGEENLIQKIKEVLTPAVSAPKSLPQDFHPVCATPAFVWITGHGNELSPEAQKELSLIMPQRPTYSFPAVEKTYNTPSGHFKIHYVTTTIDSVYQSHVVDSSGVPLYVIFIGGIADFAWTKEVDTLGYVAPPSDLSFPGNGGDGRYDIYLKSMAYGYLGYSQPEYYAPPDYIGATSFIVLRNDYSLYGGSYNNYPRVTTAHEFFHAVQFGYDVDEMEYVPSDTIWAYHPYWMELTATWMEDKIYDSINDYVSYLPYFYNYPWLSLKAFSYDPGDPSRYYHAYAACVWAFYLSEKFGLNTVRDIWTMCADVQGDNVLSATDDALLLKGSSLDQAFREFSVWNYFTNFRADTSNYYSEGNLYPVVKVDPNQQYSIYPVNVASVPHPPEVLSTNYVEYVPDLTFSPDNLAFYLNGSDSAKWKSTIIGYSSTNPKYFAEIALDSFQVGRAKVNNWGNYSKIMMIPAVVTRTSGSFNYSYAAFKCGDANTSGNVNLADIVYLVSYLFKSGFPPIPMQSGDANSDGVVNLADIVYLVSYLFKHGPQPCG